MHTCEFKSRFCKYEKRYICLSESGLSFLTQWANSLYFSWRCPHFRLLCTYVSWKQKGRSGERVWYVRGTRGLGENSGGHRNKGHYLICMEMSEANTFSWMSTKDIVKFKKKKTLGSVNRVCSSWTEEVADHLKVGFPHFSRQLCSSRPMCETLIEWTAHCFHFSLEKTCLPPVFGTRLAHFSHRSGLKEEVSWMCEAGQDHLPIFIDCLNL